MPPWTTTLPSFAVGCVFAGQNRRGRREAEAAYTLDLLSGCATVDCRSGGDRWRAPLAGAVSDQGDGDERF